ncbi:type II toxin-antitoxin system RelE/ParE family toxin [Novosphingobium sp. NDB2Meth1]|uniref:type II toxin-antitoxin system RelE/ParE family toxin n=1 Tax=Novosphingobium sp. NDB2Meth1 TaxID=1892847 RepID=UPI0009319AE3|nr:type II toxin-antitoxin system RelE/ParE family toxin [Novosphingobium sp. NDB2Meth1]
MHEVRISRQAQADLEEIQLRSLTEFGAPTTRAFMAGFDDILARLKMYPLVGRVRPEYGRNVRSCLRAPYLVLYRFEADIVSIQRILHSSRRTEPLGKGEP